MALTDLIPQTDLEFHASEASMVMHRFRKPGNPIRVRAEALQGSLVV